MKVRVTEGEKREGGRERCREGRREGERKRMTKRFSGAGSSPKRLSLPGLS